MREAASVFIQVHGFIWARCAAHVQWKFPHRQAEYTVSGRECGSILIADEVIEQRFAAMLESASDAVDGSSTGT